MYRKSIKKTEFEDQSSDIGLCPNGINNAQKTCPSANQLLSRDNGQGKTHCSQCERIASKKGLCEKHYRQHWRSLNKEHNKQYASQYHQTIRKPILQSQHKPKQKTCIRCSNLFTRTGANQKFCSKTCQNNISHKKKRLNPEFKLIHNLRSRLRKALKGQSRDKGILVLIDCSASELKIYLESKFTEGMTWNNYGKWHIDHITPLNSFDLSDSEQLKKACHYTNLQPLWAEANIAKSDTV